ncbi:MAG TPA: transaldolase [Nevskiaceae bacterium]
MKDAIRALQELGQSLWLDNITRAMLDDGTLVGYRDRLGVTGLTSNPTIFQKAIAGSEAYLPAIRASGERDSESLFFDLAIDDLRRAADIFADVHRRTAGVDGWVSLEVSPLLADDTEKTVAQAEALRRRAARDNLYIKVPGTKAGVAAIEELIHRGVPVNVTLLFSPVQYRAAAGAYMAGLERRAREGLSLDVPSVASIFISRWDVKVAEKLPEALRNTLGLAVAAATYVSYRHLLTLPRMKRLMNLGARPQRLLWASTGTKDPQASDVLYVENLAAPLTINTMPDKTLHAWQDHGVLAGEVAPALSLEATPATRALQRYVDAVGDIEALADVLQREGAEKFDKSWRALLASLETRMKEAA